jgi:hypothetical protein
MPHFSPSTRWLSSTPRTCYTSFDYSGVSGAGSHRQPLITHTTITTLISILTPVFIPAIIIQEFSSLTHPY